jgi:hypothetical protein
LSCLPLFLPLSFVHSQNIVHGKQMKKFISMLFAAVIVASASASASANANANADDRQILVDRPFDHGGFGSMVLGWTMLGESANYLFGIKGAWLLNHSYYIGGSGAVALKSVAADESYSASGLILGYKHNAMQVWHLAGEMFLGSGGIVRDDNTVVDSFVVVEPSAILELNVDRYTTVGAALSYRYAHDTNPDLSGIALTLNLSAGIF